MRSVIAILFVSQLILCHGRSLDADPKDSIRLSLTKLNDEAYEAYNSSPQTSIAISRKVVSAADLHGLVQSKIIAYKNIGLAYWRLAELDSSLFYNELGRILADSIGDDLQASKILNNTGLIYQDREQYYLSLESFLAAYQVQKSYQENRSLSITTTNIGVIYQRLGDYLKAEQFFNEALETAQEETFQFTECYASCSLIKLYTQTVQYDLATSSYEMASDVCGEIENKYFQSLALFNYGLLLFKQKKFNESLNKFTAALKIQEAVGDLKKQNETYNWIGRTLLKLGNHESARQNLLKAEKIATENDFMDELKNSNLYLAKIDSAQSNFSSAYARQKRYHDLSDTLNKLQQYRLLSEAKIRFDTKEKEIENEILRKEKKLQEDVITKQELKSIFLYIGIGMSLVIIGIYASYSRSIKRRNQDLSYLNEQIKSQAEELVMANEKAIHHNKELRQTLKKLTEAQDQLVEAEKMASLGSLSAGIGHEINNPLNFIKVGIDQLSSHYKETFEEDEKVNKFIDIINEGVSRASSIVKSLSHFSRSGTQMNENCDINAILDNCLLILGNKLKNRVTISKSYSEIPIHVSGNEGRLHQAFMNILTNAEQAIEEKGEIKIKTGQTAKYAFVKVTDNGIGIEKKNLSKIMNPFFTTKEPGKGTGLGLSITYKIIEEHMGKILVESEVGKGATFTIELPLNEEA